LFSLPGVRDGSVDGLNVVGRQKPRVSQGQALAQLIAWD
jgi:hypothetical protein